MNNNDIFKKLRVALQLRDDQIVAIMQLVDFRISAAELGAFFRNADHPKYMDCGDQVLRNFLNGLVIHLRGTKENPKNAMDVIKQNQEAVKKNTSAKQSTSAVTGLKPKPKTEAKKKPFNPKNKKPAQKIEIVEKVQYKNGKNKK
ncbi:MAG: DUF1456 family protein [Flavobacterium sp.]